MKNINYKKLIQEAKNHDELNKVKNDFLAECLVRENKIAVTQLLAKINNFCDAKAMFESIAPSLISMKSGKQLINKYINIIKENKSLKTLYAYYEGLSKNETPVSKKTYITEALSLGNNINQKEYLNGVKSIIGVITESFKILGDEFVLKNVSHNETSSIIGESLCYLSSTNKNIKNLNDYIKHIDIVSENITENKNTDINVDMTLDEIISNTLTTENVNIKEIFESENKEESFKKNKQLCLEMISSEKSKTKDKEVLKKLNEIESKLSNKTYQFESFTKDMFYMTELQEMLK